jgi:hypothetical protein
MARLRLRLRFNPGRSGGPIDRLGEFASQTDKFLRSFSKDIGAPSRKGEWIAQNFTNESIAFDIEWAGSVAPAIQSQGLFALKELTSNNPINACNKGYVSHGTMAEYSRLSKALDPDEHFEVGIYTDDSIDTATEWKNVYYSDLAQIRQLLDAPFIAYGTLQAVIHNWAMEADSPNFTARELSTGNLVKCFYERRLHGLVHEATKEPHIVLLIYGDTKWDRTTNYIVDVHVSKIEMTKSISDSEFDKLFGSMPNLTGDLSTSEYIEWLRGDGD